MNSNKIVLGTVQFGTQYGVNSAGRPNEDVVKTILQESHRNGIQLLDTSSAYGDSEEVLGRTMQSAFQIISKYPQCDLSVKECFTKTLSHLKVDKLYGYLLHHFSIYRSNSAMWNDMIALKREGKVTKIGFSLYVPEELEIILKDGIEFDLIQIPHNIFDNQFDLYFPLLKEKGVKIHVRSTFLQGLFFKDRDTLPEKLQPLKSYLQELDKYVADNNISMSELALNYNLQNPYIDGVLIGVDNGQQFQANMDALRNGIRQQDIDFVSSINVLETELLNPINWK